jgi:hypothetical protein
MLAVSQGKVVPPSTRRPDLPAELEAVILRAMSPSAAARFPSVHALGAALLPFASPRKQVLWSHYFAGESGDPPPTSRSSRHTLNPVARTSEAPTRKASTVVLRAAFVLALAATAGALVWRQELFSTREQPAPPPVVRAPAATRPATVPAPVLPGAGTPGAERMPMPAASGAEAAGGGTRRLTTPARGASQGKRRTRGRRPTPAAETSPASAPVEASPPDMSEAAPAPTPARPAEQPAPPPFIEP